MFKFCFIRIHKMQKFIIQIRILMLPITPSCFTFSDPLLLSSIFLSTIFSPFFPSTPHILYPITLLVLSNRNTRILLTVLLLVAFIVPSLTLQNILMKILLCHPIYLKARTEWNA